ncbi:hypothetical protein HAX54_017448 [Datura stramonium]|uniref:Uncharacterized protein n=1 Tax=Datura stramonium TaxID=4076 RepID=A0ABS8UMT1_DATST|nr:hypothetical protein [Datura stramonium]
MLMYGCLWWLPEMIFGRRRRRRRGGCGFFPKAEGETTREKGEGGAAAKRGGRRVGSTPANDGRSNGGGRWRGSRGGARLHVVGCVAPTDGYSISRGLAVEWGDPIMCDSEVIYPKGDEGQPR